MQITDPWAAVFATLTVCAVLSRHRVCNRGAAAGAAPMISARPCVAMRFDRKKCVVVVVVVVGVCGGGAWSHALRGITRRRRRRRRHTTDIDDDGDDDIRPTVVTPPTPTTTATSTATTAAPSTTMTPTTMTTPTTTSTTTTTILHRGSHSRCMCAVGVTAFDSDQTAHPSPPLRSRTSRGARATMAAVRDLASELHGAAAVLDDLVAQGAERASTLAKLCIDMTGRLTRLPKSDDTAAMCDELSAAITDGPWTARQRDAMISIVDARVASAVPPADVKPFQHCER